jgi:hypothetical protein
MRAGADVLSRSARAGRPGGLVSAEGGAILVFDSFRHPFPAGMRTAGVRVAGFTPRQLIYKAGRYSIRLRVGPETGSDRLSIVGQIVDEQGGANPLQDIAVLALDADTTLDETLTNDLGEFSLVPHASESLQLSIGLPEIGTFTVHSQRSTEEPPRGAEQNKGNGSGRGEKARRR